MPILTFTEDYTTLTDCEDVGLLTEWGVGAGKWVDETEIYIENSQSVGLKPFAVGEGGIGIALGASFNATQELVTVWVFTTPGFLNTSAVKGVYIRLGSDNGGDFTVDYYDYVVGGSNVAWVGSGWHQIVLDPNRTTNRTSSGAPNLATIYNVGVGFTVTATASKSTVIAVDIMQRGTYLEVTGPWSADPGGNGLDFNENGAGADTITRDDAGDFSADGWEIGDICVVSGTTTSNGEYEVFGVAAATLTLSIGDFTANELNVTAARLDAVIGFQDIIDKDETDDSWFGTITKSINAEFEVNSPLYVGDQSGADRVYFRTRGEKVVITDQPNEEEGKLIVIEDTGRTAFNAGDSDGVDDDRVGFGGTVFSQDNTFNGCTGSFDFSDTVDLLEVYGSLFLNVVGGIAFAADTDHLVTNCSFDVCGQVDLGSVEARNLTFSGYELTAAAALLWNTNIDVENSRFLANRNSSSDASAIEHTAIGEFDYNNLTFAGNDYDVHNSSAGLVTINNLGTSDANTHKETGGGSTSIVTQVRLTLTELYANTEVRIYRVSDGAYLGGIENSGVSFEYNYVFPGGNFDVYVQILHMTWLYNRLDVTLTNANQVIPVQYSIDRVYSNP